MTALGAPSARPRGADPRSADADLQGPRRGHALSSSNDVFHLERYNNLPGFADATPTWSRRSSQEAAKLCEEAIAPFNLSGDREGCTRHAGWQRHDAEGLQGSLPGLRRRRLDGPLGARRNSAARACRSTLNTVMQEFVSAANLALGMYPGLTQGAIAALFVHGSRGAEADLSAEDDRRRAGPAP